MKNNYYELAEKTKELYLELHNIKKVAKQLGFSIPKARKMLITAGVPFSKRHEEILQLYKKGLSLKEMSEITGLATNSVNYYLPYKESLIDEEKQSKKTKQNHQALLRKEALKNKADVKGILAAFSGCKGFNYKYFEDGILIDGIKYGFDSEEAKTLLTKIIEKKTKK